MSDRIAPFKLLDHTADIGLAVSGRTKKQLFIHAAQGMFFLLCDTPLPYQPRLVQKKAIKKTITFSGIDDEMLLVAWLQELLYNFTEKHYYPVAYTSISLKPHNGNAHIQTMCVQKDDMRIKYDIKAVTYHQLQITYKRQQYQASIIFDV